MTRVHAALVLSAMLFLGAQEFITGRINVNDGRGFDGNSYARLLDGDFGVSPNILLRPAIVLFNVPARAALGDTLSAFRLMNYVYAALLCLALCTLLTRHGATTSAKVVFVTCVFLSIAVSKMFAYYPVLVDLGAYAVITWALVAVVDDRPLIAAIGCVAAVLSREFGIAVIAFAMVRAVRLRWPWQRTLLVSAPALLAFVGWRWLVATTTPSEDMNTATSLWANLRYWRDPFFIALYVYFLATIVGGASLAVIARPVASLRAFAREPEYGVYTLAILGIAAIGSFDLWRYLAYALPAFVPPFASVWLDVSPGRRWAVGMLALLATAVTQRPWEPMTQFSYFRDWFPYYVQRNPGSYQAELWPVWGWHFAVAAVMAILLVAALHRASTRIRSLIIATGIAVVLIGATALVAWSPGVTLRPMSARQTKPHRYSAVPTTEATVRWLPVVTDDERRRLEDEYGLWPVRDEGGRTWRYRIDGGSRVKQVLADPRVEDSAYFERLTWRYRYAYVVALFDPARVAVQSGSTRTSASEEQR
jgi:hypothetical protein